MTDEHVKAIMAAIIFTDMDKESFMQDGECVFDVAASLAEDLFIHVTEGHPEDEELPSILPKLPKGQAN